jgi:hypothetical protein
MVEETRMRIEGDKVHMACFSMLLLLRQVLGRARCIPEPSVREPSAYSCPRAVAQEAWSNSRTCVLRPLLHYIVGLEAWNTVEHPWKPKLEELYQ